MPFLSSFNFENGVVDMKNTLKTKMQEIRFLFLRSWHADWRLYLVAVFRSLATAVVPLINISSLGMIVDALLNQQYDRIIRIILLFLSLRQDRTKRNCTKKANVI